MLVTTELHARVEARVAELLREVRTTHAGFPTPRIDYFDRRKAAGTANLRTNTIAFNAVLLRENTESMLHETVAHELAHLVVWYAYQQRNLAAAFKGWTKRPAPHGVEWQNVMRKLGVEPKRTHNFDCTNVRSRRVTKYTYRCACRVLQVGPVVHRKAQAGHLYRCQRCKSGITLVAAA